MVKNKFNWSGFLNILKAVLFAIVITLLCIVIFAVVLKFADLPISVVSYVNNGIKILALLFAILFVKKSNSEKLLIKSIFTGLIYAILTFLIFSIFNGGFSFNVSIIFDILYSVVVAIILAVILNVTSKKHA